MASRECLVFEPVKPCTDDYACTNFFLFCLSEHIYIVPWIILNLQLRNFMLFNTKIKERNDKNKGICSILSPQ